MAFVTMVALVTVVVFGATMALAGCELGLDVESGSDTVVDDGVVVDDGDDDGDDGDDKTLITYTAEQYYPSEDNKTSVQIRLTFSEASAEIENLMMYDVTITAGTASVTTVNAVTGVKTNKAIWLTSVTAPDGEGYITLSINLKGVETGEKTVVVYQAPDAAPTVSAVVVSPSTASVVKGNTQAFTAGVAGTGSPAQSVTWSIDGTPAAGTGIATDGTLTVAAGETAATLTIRATSTVDTTKSGTTAVTVTAPGDLDTDVDVDSDVDTDGGDSDVDSDNPPPAPPPPPAVNYSAVQVGGTPSYIYSSTGIDLRFDTAVTGLTANDITITNDTGVVTKGSTLTGSGQQWTIDLTSVTARGTVKVKVTKSGIAPEEKNVTVYKETHFISYQARQTGGVLDTSDSTGIELTFTETPVGLTAGDIQVTGDTGAVVVGAMTGSGTTRRLALTSVITQGTVTVKIDKIGPDIGYEIYPRTVTVCKAPSLITYTAVERGGTPGAVDSNGITLTFSPAAPPNLTANDITITPAGSVVKGALTGSGATRTLAVSGVTAPGNVSLSIARGVTETGSKAVTLHKGPVMTWTKVGAAPSFGDHTIEAITYGGGKFVAVGGNGLIAYSTDGITWTTIPAGRGAGQTQFLFTETLYSVAYGNGKFVAAGGTKIVYSTDGITWTVAGTSPFAEGVILGIASGGYENRIFVAVSSSGQMARSLDGITWTAVADSTFDGSTIYKIIYGGDGKYVAVGGFGKMAYSINTGVTWGARTNTKVDGLSIMSITYGNGKYVAAGYQGRMAYSTDGTWWTAVADSTFDRNDSRTSNINTIRNVCFGNGLFVAGGSRGRMASSPDGVAWSATPAGTGGSQFTTGDLSWITAIAYGNGKFVAVGTGGEIAYYAH
jgi:hypothetical protein